MGVKFLTEDFINLLKEKFYDRGGEFTSHGWNDHILPVIEEAQFICSQLGVEYTPEIEYACAMHDIGLIQGRNNHEIHGAKLADILLEKMNMNQDSIDKIKSMIICHRASMLKDEKLRKIMLDGDHLSELIVSLADRCYSKIDAHEYFKRIARRSLTYHLSKNDSMLDSIADVEKHFREKYGLNGYAYLNPLLKKVREIQLDEYVQKRLDSELGFDQEVYKALDGEIICGYSICYYPIDYVTFKKER